MAEALAQAHAIEDGTGPGLRIRPARRSLDCVLAKFGGFSDDFMAAGREANVEAERDAL